MNRNLTHDEILKKCEETQRTAIEIKRLLDGLTSNYDNALKALGELENSIGDKINNFNQDLTPTINLITEAKASIENMTKEMEQARIDIAAVKELASTTEASINRLEKLNENITQIEQRIVNLIGQLSIEELEKKAAQIHSTFDRNIKLWQEELDYQFQQIKETIDRQAEEKGFALERNYKKYQEDIDMQFTQIEKELEKYKKDLIDTRDTILLELKQATKIAINSVKETSTTEKQSILALSEKEQEAIRDLGHATLSEIALKGSKRITFKTIEQFHMPPNAIGYQEIFVDANGDIVKYGDFFIKGGQEYTYLGSNNNSGHPIQLKMGIPKFIDDPSLEFFKFLVYWNRAYAVCKQYPNRLYMRGYGGSGSFGLGNTQNILFSDKIFKEGRNYFEFRANIRQMWSGDWNGTDSARCNMFVLLENDELWVCGRNESGELGLGHASQVNTWTLSKSNVKEICKFQRHTSKEGIIDNRGRFFITGLSGSPDLPSVLIGNSWINVSPSSIKGGNYTAMWNGNRAYCSLSYLISSGTMFLGGNKDYSQHTSQDNSPTSILTNAQTNSKNLLVSSALGHFYRDRSESWKVFGRRMNYQRDWSSGNLSPNNAKLTNIAGEFLGQTMSSSTDDQFIFVWMLEKQNKVLFTAYGAFGFGGMGFGFSHSCTGAGANDVNYLMIKKDPSDHFEARVFSWTTNTALVYIKNDKLYVAGAEQTGNAADFKSLEHNEQRS